MISLAYAALWMFIFALPWENTMLVPGIGLLSKPLGVMALGFALFAAVITGRLRRWHLFHVAALLFVLWAGCVLLAINIAEVPPKFYTFVQLFLVLWIIWQLAPSKQRILGLLVAYVLGAYVAALDTIFVFRNQAGALRRFAAGGVDPNDLANILALGLPMAWYLGMTYRRPLVRWVGRAYLPIGLLAIGLTGSRGGMLTSVVGLLIVPLTLHNLSPGRLAAAIVMLGLSGALAMAYVPETLLQRFAGTGAEVQEGDLHGRLEIWTAGVKAFAQKPLMGYGSAGFKAAIQPWVGRRVAHNSFLSVLVEQGLVGFLLYAMMLLSVFLAVLNLRGQERRFALVLLAALGIAMLPLTWEDRKAVWFILAVLLGLSMADDGAERQAAPNQVVATTRPLMARRPTVRPTPRPPGLPARTPRRNA